MGLIKFMADSIRQGLRSFLRVNPAHDKIITINERTNHMTECACNRVWYRGKSELLSDLYAELDVPSTMFWKASSTPGLEIRKIHTGLPALMCDTIANIIIADYNGFEISSKSSTVPIPPAIFSALTEFPMATDPAATEPTSAAGAKIQSMTPRPS